MKNLCKTLLPIALLALSAAAAEPKYTVLKIVVGDDTTFEVVLEDQANARKKELAESAKADLVAWTAGRDAFVKDRANHGKEYLEPKPEAPKVSKAKTFATEPEAKAYADAEQKEAEGKYAVIRVKGLDGKDALETLRQNKVKSRELELKREFEKQNQQWQKRCDAYYAQPAPPGTALQPFAEPKPSAPKVERLKDGFLSPEEADKFRESLGK